MKRLCRWVFNGLAAVSMLLFLAMAISWVRSVSAFDEWDLLLSSQSGDVTFISIETGRGRLCLDTGLVAYSILRKRSPARTDDTQPEFRHFSFEPLYPSGMDLNHPGIRGFSAKGFEFSFFRSDSMVRFEYRLIAPMWAWMLLWAFLPAICGTLYKRRRSVEKRKRKGLCPSCGYDLRPTPDRCPECGITVSAKKEITSN